MSLNPVAVPLYSVISSCTLFAEYRLAPGTKSVSDIISRTASTTIKLK